MEETNNVIIYIIAGVAAVLALVLLVVICIIGYICVSLCRTEKEDDNFGGFTRRSSFRMSFKKSPKLVDPLDQFRATHPWPSKTQWHTGHMKVTCLSCDYHVTSPCRPGEPPPCATEWVPVPDDGATS